MGFWFGLICAVPFLMVLGNSMLFPVFSKLQAAIHLSELKTSMIVTAFSVPAGLLIPFAGFLSDRFGRKKVMTPSVGIFGIGALVGGLSVTLLGSAAYAGLLVGRVIQGIGAAGMSQLAMALAADVYQGQQRAKALGTIEASNGFGKVLSPIAGGLVGLFLWWLPFFIFFALAVPLTILLWIFVKEPDVERSHDGVKVYLGKIGQVFQHKGKSIGALLVSGAMGLFILFGTLFYLSEVLDKTYKMPEITVGFILALPVGAMALTSYLMGLYLQKRQRQAKTAVWVGLFVVTAVMVVNAIFSDKWILFGAISFMGIGGGLVLPSLNLLFTSATEPAERGMITSLYGGVRFMGVALGPPAFGFLMRFGHTVLFLSAAVVVAIAAILALLLVKPGQMLQNRGNSDRPPRSEARRTAGPEKTKVR